MSNDLIIALELISLVVLLLGMWKLEKWCEGYRQYFPFQGDFMFRGGATFCRVWQWLTVLCLWFLTFVALVQGANDKISLWWCVMGAIGSLWLWQLQLIRSKK